MHRTLAFLAAVVLTTISVATAGFASVPGTVQFRLEPARSADRVQLSMRHGRNNWSSATEVSDLRGLDVARLHAASTAPVGFALVREAGRFDCSGQGGQSSARGECRFIPDSGFSDYLASRGIGRPDRDQAYALAMSGVGRAHVEALSANRYPSPTVDQLVAMGIHGATPGFIRELGAAGYRLKSAKDLVTFRIHGVTPRFIEELSQLGYRGVAADDLVRMRIFGVTPDYIRSIERRGVGRLPVDELVQMRIMGHRRPAR